MSDAVLPRAAACILRREPTRSTIRPKGAEASACVVKKRETAVPSAAAPKPSSALICTASPPVRKTGSTPHVATAIAHRTVCRPDRLPP